MQYRINISENLQHFKSGVKCISAEEKLLKDASRLLGFWIVKICIFMEKHFAAICVLICATLLLHHWITKVLNRSLPPDVLYQRAIDSYDKVNAHFCIEAVKKNGYDVNHQNAKDKLSLFMCACVGGNSEVISFMIKRGADLKHFTAYGDSALYLATYGYLCSPKPDLGAIAMLVKHGCDVNQPNSPGFTVLHQAAGKGNMFLTRYFILKGADPSKSNHNGLLPHHMALMKGHYAVADFLMERLKPLSKRAPSSV